MLFPIPTTLRAKENSPIVFLPPCWNPLSRHQSLEILIIWSLSVARISERTHLQNCLSALCFKEWVFVRRPHCSLCCFSVIESYSLGPLSNPLITWASVYSCVKWGCNTLLCGCSGNFIRFNTLIDLRHTTMPDIYWALRKLQFLSLPQASLHFCHAIKHGNP
jgi:hypothetical protein